jgi:hypothetical protein
MASFRDFGVSNHDAILLTIDTYTPSRQMVWFHYRTRSQYEDLLINSWNQTAFIFFPAGHYEKVGSLYIPLERGVVLAKRCRECFDSNIQKNIEQVVLNKNTQY